MLRPQPYQPAATSISIVRVTVVDAGSNLLLLGFAAEGGSGGDIEGGVTTSLSVHLTELTSVRAAGALLLV